MKLSFFNQSSSRTEEAMAEKAKREAKKAKQNTIHIKINGEQITNKSKTTAAEAKSLSK